jgi:hypothetical protein
MSTPDRLAGDATASPAVMAVRPDGWGGFDGRTASHGVLGDPTMAFLRPALEQGEVERRFRQPLRELFAEPVELEVRGIRVVRHKPGRRCLIEFDLRVGRASGRTEPVALLGKARARGLDERSYRVQKWLWNNGFSSNHPDGISVPEPVGLVPELRLWLQRRVDGHSPIPLLTGSAGLDVARRIADASHKLHGAGFVPDREHRISDELRILHERLGPLARAEPRLARRLQRVLAGCDRVASAVSQPAIQGIHRDFYPDQVLVNGDRLYLLDFDLFCAGDPALDIGNFLGHLVEHGLRCAGDPEAFTPAMEEIERHFLARRKHSHARAAVHAYLTLTLARHIEISTRFPDRKPFTELLLDLCERRLGPYLPRRS